MRRTVRRVDQMPGSSLRSSDAYPQPLQQRLAAGGRVPDGRLVRAVRIGAGDTAIHVVRSQAGLPPLAGDFGKLAWESGGWILSTVPGAWNQVDLNAIGLKWINKTGLTRLALAANPDMFDYPPACGNSITVPMAGEGRAPVLSVQYIP